MADSQRLSTPGSRPPIPHSSQSFTRLEKKLSDAALRRRANTAQVTTGSAIAESRHDDQFRPIGELDVFEKDESLGQAIPSGGRSTPDLKLPKSFNDLPIELQSSTERFLESLSAKIHPSPLSADQLSQMFQDFYEKAADQINTHIATLSARIGREKSNSSTPVAKTNKTRSRAGSGTGTASLAGGEMLTVTEVSERRKARRILELERLALEDAVEKVVCEKVYERIWKHRNTDDDARDEKLRSRIAALALIGVGFRELHTDSDTGTSDIEGLDDDKELEISRSLTPARDAIMQMDQEMSPLGKLQCLTAVHKSIVETLSQVFPSSSSADEVLPTLIYTLITLPKNGTNAISNLNFIQRFRWAQKIDGEAAYCLVNLEAAIVFLETVDVSSIRASEAKGSRPASREVNTTDVIIAVQADADSLEADAVSTTTSSPVASITVSSITSKPTQDATGSLKALTVERPALHQRRLSDMLQSQADRLGAGRENFLSAADRVYESIGGSLDNSLQFVFGRFKDQALGGVTLPKTLDDARKLISSATKKHEDVPTRDTTSSPFPEEAPVSTKSETKMLDLIGGRRLARERSTESMRSTASSRRSIPEPDSIPRETTKEEPSNVASNLLSSINQINPLNRFVPGFPRFGRGSVPPPITPSLTSSDRPNRLTGIDEGDGGRSAALQTAKDDIHPNNAGERLAELRTARPPKTRFLEVENASELRIGEIEELLLDYRRLAKALGRAIAE